MSEPTCFIAMPISSKPEHEDLYGDKEHWQHVMESLFIPAVKNAGMQPIPPIADGSDLIHGSIVRNIMRADMVLCDLSSHNPNVFFELGVRTSLDLPVTLVADEKTRLPFDTAGINTHRYNSSLRGWDIEEERERLTSHLKNCIASCAGKNPLWQHFGLTLRAQEPRTEESPLEAKVDLMAARIEDLQIQIRRNSSKPSRTSTAVSIEELLGRRELPLSDRTEEFLKDVGALNAMEALGVFSITSVQDGRVLVTPKRNFSSRSEHTIRLLAAQYGVEITFDEHPT